MHSAIYIDDTGNPGLKSESKYDSNDRKSWVALLFTSKQREHATFEMNGCIEEIKCRYDANEFHFKDIYNGKKEFKNISLEIRIGLIEMFAAIFKQMNYPILIQTFSSDDILRNRIISEKLIKLDNFNISDNSDFALFFLLFRIKKYLTEKVNFERPIEIIIDEGRQKKNTFQDCLFLNGLLKDNKLNYHSSCDEPLLQLVDFVAFCLNRNRWILTHKDKTDLDKTMLRIFSEANFNVLNMEKKLINLEDDTVKLYDDLLANTFQKNNNLDEITLEEFKRIMNQ